MFFYQTVKSLILSIIMLSATHNYANDKLSAPLAPYENKGGNIQRQKPELKEVVTTTTHWKNKVNYKKAGFYIGNKSLNVKEKLSVLKPESGNVLYMVINSKISALLQMWGSTKGGYGHPFKMVEASKPQLKVDKEKGLFTWRKEFYLNKEKTETSYFTYTAALQQDGLIKLTWEVEASDEQWKKYRTDYALFIHLRDFFDTKITMNGKLCSFIPGNELKKQKSHRVWQGKCEKFVFNSDNIANGFTISFPGKQKGFILEKLDWQKKPSAYLRVNPAARYSKKISILLDISMVTSSSTKKSSDIHAGIDFWKSDRLHVPDYSKSINLIQNPSFESALRYYTLHDTWADYRPRPKPVFEISEDVAKFGKHSLKINAWKGDKQAGYLQTFAIPVKGGEKYTLSFYAKANKKAYLKLLCVTGIWLQFPELQNTSVGTEWKRYQRTFTAPNRAVTILFGADYHGTDSDGAEIFIDGIQLQAGPQATAYIDQKISARLLTSSKDNFLNTSDAVNAKLKIIGPANSSGKLKLKLKDFFGAKPWEKTISFTTNKNGEIIIELPLDKIIKNGIYVLRADINFTNGDSLTDFFRISRMKFLNNEHRNRNISSSSISIRQSRAEDMARRFQQIGIGSSNYQVKQKDIKLLKKYGILSTSIHGAVSRKKLKNGRKIYQLRSFQDKADVYVEDLTTIISVSPELEQQVEDAAYKLAKANPWIETWNLVGEANAGGFMKFDLLRKGKWRDFGKILVAFYKGIKKFDPAKKVMPTGGPTNMSPQNGTLFLENILKSIDGKVKFDAVAIHPYRTKPNDPDLDHDAAKFFEMLERNAYGDVPVFWNEGIYYTYYNIPAWGLSPYKGCSTDHYRAYCPSYDMGWGERISAAYFARSWLVALKYQQRVKQFNGWSSWISMDAYLTPLALQKIPNTLGNLLGNAYFKQDIRFAPKVRCYVFENEHRQPVAALWSQLDKVDYGLQQSPNATFKFNGTLKTIYDLMENERTATEQRGTVTIPISPFPIFIVGKAGSLDKFCAAIQAGQLLNSTALPITITGTPLSTTQFQLICNNHLTKQFNGKLTIAKLPKQLVIKSAASEKVVTKLPTPLKFDKISSFKIPVELIFGKQQKIKESINFEAFAIHRLNGVLDWNKLPAVSLKNRKIVKFTGSTSRIAVTHSKKVGIKGDFEASFKAAWDNEFFYLQVTVIDDKLFTIPKGKHVGGGWRYDSLQLYFDTFCDARTRKVKGYDSNDYNYDVVPNSSSQATVYRRLAPEQQIAGGLDAPRPNMIEPKVKCSFRKTATGYVYELTFPKRLLAPMLFKQNAKIGFGIYLNDNDGKGLRSALTITPPGTGCYMNPQQYPVMLLTD